MISPAAEKVWNVVIAYWHLKGYPYNPAEPIFKELAKIDSRDAKTLLSMSGGDDTVAIEKMKTVKEWAESRSLSWTIRTVARRFLETHEPKPKQPFYIEGKRKFPAKQVDGRWMVLDSGGWKTLSSTVRPKDVIVYE